VGINVEAGDVRNSEMSLLQREAYKISSRRVLGERVQLLAARYLIRRPGAQKWAVMDWREAET
jgi:hypothetical protein